MPELAQLQRALWSALTTTDGVAAALTEKTGAASMRHSIHGDARASARARLALYADMYFHRLLDALAADFPRLAATLGARDFHALAAAYVAAHPSRDPSLRHLGRALPQFLRAARGHGSAWHADLAALEWARLDVHDRIDEPVLTFARLREFAARDFAGLRLKAIAAHARVATDHDVTTAWRQDETEEVDAPPRDPGVIVVWRRPDNVVHHRRVTGMEAALIAALETGLDFEALCAQLRSGSSDEAAALRALELVGAWTADGLLAESLA